MAGKSFANALLMSISISKVAMETWGADVPNGTGREQTYRIVGEDEADPNRGTISYVSPVARALLGKQVGEVVRVGQSDIELVAIA
jgi:transcription elongation GreA/GreB family factor